MSRKEDGSGKKSRRNAKISLNVIACLNVETKETHLFCCRKVLFYWKGFKSTQNQTFYSQNDSQKIQNSRNLLLTQDS
jgi:hypothetical protein